MFDSYLSALSSRLTSFALQTSGTLTGRGKQEANKKEIKTTLCIYVSTPDVYMKIKYCVSTNYSTTVL